MKKTMNRLAVVSSFVMCVNLAQACDGNMPGQPHGAGDAGSASAGLWAVQDQMSPGSGMTGHSDVRTHLDERFDAADVNHDGGLDREEAKNMPMLSKYFDEVDANHDGKVTRQEYFNAMPLLHGVKKIDITGKSQSM